MICPTFKLRDAVLQKIKSDFGEPEVEKKNCFGYDNLVLKMSKEDNLRVTIVSSSFADFKGQHVVQISFQDYLEQKNTPQLFENLRNSIPHEI